MTGGLSLTSSRSIISVPVPVAGLPSAGVEYGLNVSPQRIKSGTIFLVKHQFAVTVLKDRGAGFTIVVGEDDGFVFSVLDE